jgi:hypothetical protein
MKYKFKKRLICEFAKILHLREEHKHMTIVRNFFLPFFKVYFVFSNFFSNFGKILHLTIFF